MIAPYEYQQINLVTSQGSPSTVHAHNTELTRYFMRYLTQRAITQFKWTLPKAWVRAHADRYLLFVLYAWGPVAVFNTDKYGVIPQGCTLSGYNVFYQPRRAVVANPLIRGAKELEIGRNCCVMSLSPDWCSPIDKIAYYADMMALTVEAAAVNIVNSKLAYVFAANNKASAETFNKMFDQINAGNPASVVDKSMFNDEGDPLWQTFTQNLHENYIAPEQLETLRAIERQFDTDFGIPNANTEKRERLISSEVMSNQQEVRTLGALWLDNLQTDLELVRDMFDFSESELNVKWREYGDRDMIVEGGGLYE